MSKIGFIGLGVMGFPMAGHLSKVNSVAVFNRTKEKIIAWQRSHDGIVCESPEHLGEICSQVYLCIGDDDDVREVVAGEKGLVNSLQSGSIIIDHTTTSASLSREMYETCKKLDIDYIDDTYNTIRANDININNYSDIYCKDVKCDSIILNKINLNGFETTSFRNEVNNANQTFIELITQQPRKFRIIPQKINGVNELFLKTITQVFINYTIEDLIPRDIITNQVLYLNWLSNPKEFLGTRNDLTPKKITAFSRDKKQAIF